MGVGGGCRGSGGLGVLLAPEGDLLHLGDEAGPRGAREHQHDEERVEGGDDGRDHEGPSGEVAAAEQLVDDPGAEDGTDEADDHDTCSDVLLGEPVEGTAVGGEDDQADQEATEAAEAVEHELEAVVEASRRQVALVAEANADGEDYADEQKRRHEDDE